MATIKTNFITGQYIKDFLGLDINIDDKLLISPILVAQEEYILPALGTSLYTELINQVSASTISSTNQTLLDTYIRPCLSHFAKMKAAKNILFKWTGKSIEKQTGENTESISKEELAIIEEELRKGGEILLSRMRNFLLANTSIYPLYLTIGTSLDSILPDQQNTTSSFFSLPDRSRIRRYGFDNPNMN